MSISTHSSSQEIIPQAIARYAVKIRLGPFRVIDIELLSDQ